MLRRRLAYSLVLLVGISLMSESPAAAEPTVESDEDVELDEFGLVGTVDDWDDGLRDAADTATPPTDDLSDPSPETITRTAEVAGAALEAQGVPRCRFDALLTDQEAESGVAPGQIDRLNPACETEDAEPDPDAPPEAQPPTYEEIVAWASSEYLRLPLDPSPISYQPDGTWAAVNLDFIVYTDAEAQVFQRDLLGMDITFTATPVHYSWDFGDGSPPLATSSPGNPYPRQDVAHVYSSAHDGVTVAVSTTWQGSFQIDGGPPIPVPGAAVTTAQAGPVEIVTFDVALVRGDD